MSDLIPNALNNSFILSIPILLISIVLLFKLVSTILKLITTIICLFMLAISWMYFVEPNMLMVKEVNIPIGVEKTIVFISDPHFGVNKNYNFAMKIANEINKLEKIDMVLWGGDFVEKLSISDMDKVLSPLKLIRFPQYGVLGNHDYQYSQSSKQRSVYEPTEYSLALVSKLKNNNIEIIDNQSIILGDLTINGISARTTTYQNLKLPANTPNKNIVLTHEPVTSQLIDGANLLTLAGHKHCGQIKLPLISEKLKPKDTLYPDLDKYNEGLYETIKGKVFVSCGVGETILPLRLNNPPTIYKIKLY
jgi:uncharacterized protein